MIRPSYAGILYEKDYVPLLNQIHSCYEHAFGPREFARKRNDAQRIYGVVVPYSSYAVSGPCAAWSYKLIAEHYFPETYVLLVPDTQGVFVNYVVVAEDFQTPFGVCLLDRPFAQALVNTGIVSLARVVCEFALEVQLPFLQHASRDKLQDLRILPIIVPHSHNAAKLAEELVRIKRDIVVLLCAHFSLQRASDLSEETLEMQDLTLARFILDLDLPGLHQHIGKNKGFLHAAHVLSLGLEILQRLGVEKGELLHSYRSSLLVPGDGSEGYTSIVF